MLQNQMRREIQTDFLYVLPLRGRGGTKNKLVGKSVLRFFAVYGLLAVFKRRPARRHGGSPGTARQIHGNAAFCLLAGRTSPGQAV